ncbi:MAG: phosphatidylglycerol lysyltransferase domain-containing protein [Clostridia bacterium]|nr:phosphatidylglycerol lysyltransferase domain-containing protein [Clostridia bacterium]
MQNNAFEIKAVTLKDKELFDRYFSINNGINSEYTFTNMFMWRKSYNIRYAVIGGMLCIFSQHTGSAETVNFPLGDGDIAATVKALIDYFEKTGQRPLIRIYCEAEMKALTDAFPDTFIFTEDRNSFDYVYKVSDLINLPGGKYHAKRNHINRFLALYNYEYNKITEEHLDTCYDMFEHWCDSKEDSVPGISEQREAVKELLENFTPLKVSGGGIFVDGQLAAFSFGEVLNKEKAMAVIHLEHANTDFQGSFPLINQQFLAGEWSHLEYVNREEDMGLSGLRQAKKSYHPCLMVKKYIASLK